MIKEKIKNRITEVFKDVLDDDSIELFRETTAENIEAWDSLSHISIIVAIEKEFNIKFDLKDIMQLQNIGEFIDLIEQKIF
ncbi:MAG: acyl carrier protein [Chlorobiaceae bacterium]|jgi:acyl carrier protein|nr:acyl carrier protein [Chlorobiaceae bacterium]NTV16635.1 acyl carrier protein [Chlorobiaceae bacterium]